MFVETRTTHTEVLEDLYMEVGHVANRANADAYLLRTHPTMITRTAVRNSLVGLRAVASAARSVSGGELPVELTQRVIDAEAAVIAALDSTKR